MALLERQLQAINQLVEALSTNESRILLYLCGSLDTDCSRVCLRDLLKSEVIHHDNDELFLPELMLHLRRCDILRKVLKTSREEVETALKHRQVLPRFRVLMARINEEMTNEDLSSVKFLLGSTLPREQLEKAKSFLDVTVELEKLDLVSPGRVDLLEQCLRNISRIDLAEKVAKYKAATPERHSQQQRPRNPCPPATSNGSHSVHQTRQGHSPHTARSNMSPSNMWASGQIPLDLYKFNSNPRGVCVIIDCVGNDGDMLQQTFKDLHFSVVLHKWLSVEDSLSALKEIFRHREKHSGDGFVCCIISRGTRNNLLCTDTHRAGLHLDNVRRLFTADACPVLVGKPKLFFIQRYNVAQFQHSTRMHDRDEDLETDGCDGLTTFGSIPGDADVLWSHCWTDEYQLEQGHHRSVYLRALTDALYKGKKRKTKLTDIHTEVNAAVFDHNKRNPGANYHIDLTHTLRKDLFL